MDLKELKKLISLMNENGLVELEISEEGRRCVLKKAPPIVVASNANGLGPPSASNGAGPMYEAPAQAFAPAKVGAGGPSQDGRRGDVQLADRRDVLPVGLAGRRAVREGRRPDHAPRPCSA